MAVQGLADIAWQTDKGIVLASALTEELRRSGILLPSTGVIDRICAEAITRTSPLNISHVRAHWNEILRLATSV